MLAIGFFGTYQVRRDSNAGVMSIILLFCPRHRIPITGNILVFVFAAWFSCF